jgi:predicted amino acid-binding ACT domain protein
MKVSPVNRKPGFLLLEMILALAVFGAAATGFTVALNRMAATAALAQSELRITRIIDSAMEETLSMPVIEEGSDTMEVGETGIELETSIEPIEDLLNEDGQQLQNMFRVRITARWKENREAQELTAETWRYGMMYQP